MNRSTDQRRAKLITRVLVAVSLVFSSSGVASAACLAGGTDATIQAALNKQNVAELCQGSVFSLNNPVVFPRHNGRLYTTGLPSNDSQKATLNVTGSFATPAVQSYSRRNTRVQNIIIDGNRSGQSDYICTQALIAISGNFNKLQNSVLRNTRGLSAVASADNPNCSGLRITNNKILDSGFHATGASCQGSTTGFFANGLDYRCNNGYVAGNRVENATDGAISFYGGTNTIIENNDIINNSRSAYSGIIAASLYSGNFTGSVVRNNDIQTFGGQHLHVALAIGTHLWCSSGNPSAGDCGYGTGVSFRNNTGSGTWGWGINVEGHNNATVLDNNLFMTPWWPIGCKRTPFDNYYTVNLNHATGTFQPGFVNRETHWPCLDSSPSGQ